jgi:hypothetical protein
MEISYETTLKIRELAKDSERQRIIDILEGVRQSILQ